MFLFLKYNIRKYYCDILFCLEMFLRKIRILEFLADSDHIFLGNYKNNFKTTYSFLVIIRYYHNSRHHDCASCIVNKQESYQMPLMASECWGLNS